jgi:type IV pilus assembly protein PilA
LWTSKNSLYKSKGYIYCSFGLIFACIYGKSLLLSEQKMAVFTRITQAFSLIELMIVIAILGIVAAIAIPAYGDYIIRAKVSGMINAVDVIKQSVTEDRLEQGSLADIDPADTAATFAAIGATDPTPLSPAIQLVQFAKLTDNAMAIVICGSTAGQGTAAADTVDVYFTGAFTGSGMTWGCAYEGNSKYVPSSCRTLYDPLVYGAVTTACAH